VGEAYGVVLDRLKGGARADLRRAGMARCVKETANFISAMLQQRRASGYTYHACCPEYTFLRNQRH
jgi:predicted secreted protein